MACLRQLQVAHLRLPTLLGLLRSLGAHLRYLDVELPGEIQRRLDRLVDPLLRSPNIDHVGVEPAAEAVDMIIVDVHRRSPFVVGYARHLWGVSVDVEDPL
jgi:hypothetical protein